LKDNIWKGLKIEDKSVGLQDDMVSDVHGTGELGDLEGLRGRS
jgi:hypothetical protein